jgi:acetyl-CoA carboxylase / biotin carboxylase 1
MVAWKITLYTPQYPQTVGGREVVVIANDITHQGGSFGTKEDKLFQLASQYARERGLPRVYLAANCGARIGLADEVCVFDSTQVTRSPLRWLFYRCPCCLLWGLS